MNNFTPAQISEIIKLYTEDKMGQSACAKRVLGVDRPDLVKKILKENDVHIRTQEEALVAQGNLTEKKKNKIFFSEQNKEMAWVMGLIASIGTISKKRNTIKIGIDSRLNGEIILNGIKDSLQLEDELEHYVTHDDKDIVSLTWTCAEHKRDLAHFGITSEKKTELRPPYELDVKYWDAYIKGFSSGSHIFYPESEAAMIHTDSYILEEFESYLKDTYNITSTVRKTTYDKGKGPEEVYALFCDFVNAD